jgi:hypothetical protein
MLANVKEERTDEYPHCFDINFGELVKGRMLELDCNLSAEIFGNMHLSKTGDPYWPGFEIFKEILKVTAHFQFQESHNVFVCGGLAVILKRSECFCPFSWNNCPKAIQQISRS